MDAAALPGMQQLFMGHISNSWDTTALPGIQKLYLGYSRTSWGTAALPLDTATLSGIQ